MDCEIKILEGGEVDNKGAASMTAWIVAIETGVDVTDHFITVAPGAKASVVTALGEGGQLDPRRVAVIHGRDTAAKGAMFDFLSSLGLKPLEWSELVRATGSMAPNNRSVVEELFKMAAAVVALFTPDDEARLHPDLLPNPDQRGDGAWACQPRPNVFLEAGMALVTHPERTIFVELGVMRQASDLDGSATVRLNGTAPPLHDLAERLRTAGCVVDTTTADWLRPERFSGLEARVRLPIANAMSQDSFADTEGL